MSTRIGPALDSSPPEDRGGQSPAGLPSDVDAAEAHDYAMVTSETALPASSRTSGVDPVFAPESLPTEFGGYRVVRVLSRSVRATTAVVHAAGETRVARVFSTTCPDATIDAELAVHDAIGLVAATVRPHFVALHDLVTLPDGRLALISELTAGPALADVLETRRGRMALGEAVTILAPLADALDAAHAVGLTALTVTPSAIRFSAAGAPVVVRVSDAVAGPVLPERFRALEPAYAHDADRFQHLAGAVATAVADADRPALAAALAAPPGGRTVSEVLFDLATPVPVLLHSKAALSATTAAAAAPAPAPDPGRTPVPIMAAPTSAMSSRATPTGAPMAPRWIVAAVDALGVLGVPASVLDPVRTVAERLAARVAAMVAAAAPTLDRVRGVRRGVLVAGAAGVIALVAAIALAVSAGVGPGAESVGETESTSGTSADQTVEGAGDAPPVFPAAEGAGDALGERGPETLIDPAPEEWPAIIDELVRRWVECRATVASAETGTGQSCASQVAHAGSAAERLMGIDDRRHDTLARWREQGAESVVIERMGGAVLIDLVSSTFPDATAPTTAASLLVVRSEAGWRVRDVLGGEQTD